MKALSYCRVSTEKQAEGDKTSLDVQSRANAAKLRSFGIADADIEVVTDTDSGTKWHDRRELGPTLKKIESGHYDYVCIYNVDRAVRTWEFIAFLSTSCKKGGARLVFATRDYDQSSKGDLMMVIDAFQAQWGREDVIRKMSQGRRGRLESGKVHRFGPELYGYRRDKERGVRTIHDPEAAIVRRIFEQKASGLGHYEISKRLNLEAVPTPGASKNFTRRNSSGCWAPMTVKDMIRNPAYKGAGVAWTRQSAKGKIFKTQEADHIPVPATTTPAIVSPDLWRRANASGNHGDRARNNNRPILLRGIVFCELCGSRLYYDCSSYRCRKAFNVAGSPARCKSRPSNAAKLDAAVWQEIRQYLENPRTLQLAIDRAQASGETAEDVTRRLESARARLADLDRQQRILLDQLISSDDPAWLKLVEKKKSDIARQRKAAVDEVSELDRYRDQFESMSARAFELAERCAGMKKKISDFGFEEKRLTLEAFGVQVIANANLYRTALEFGKL